VSLTLAHGGWALEIDPALGGSVAAFRRHGADIFRATPAGASHPLETGCFPLVPYANRIAHGRLIVSGEPIALPRNVEGQAHPLHGTGWLAAWDVAAADDRSATLTHTHDGDAHWPWAYAAEQRFMLDDDGLTIALSIISHDPRPFPVSLGLHPYFAIQGVTGLRFDAGAVWLADAEMLPTEAVAADRLGDWRGGESVIRPALIDNCYAGWAGEAVIAREDGDLRLSGEGTPFLHVFTPPGEAFFCAEPVTAMPDAPNRGGATLLAPGETAGMRMRVTG
jgi:aldose 1-epimerase